MLNAVALGTFDGLHKGHLSVLNIPDSYNKIALIFDIPPKCIKKSEINLLLTPGDKIERLKSLGFDVKVLKFNTVEHLTAEEFLNYVKKELNPVFISCGFNYRFGFKGLGNTELLRDYCLENNIALQICDAVCENGEPISSSRIRKCLKDGKIAEANRLLGYDFSFVSSVIKGDGRGRNLGFPTINQEYPTDLTAPKFGVYKTEVLIENKPYEGITNIGTRPTFPIDFIISETFIKDFAGDLYGKEIKITLKDFLREEMKFSSAKSLKAQILKDIGV